MKHIGLYLGFAPDGGGAFQYAHSILLALAALPTDEYCVLVAYSLPEWEVKLDFLGDHIGRLPLTEGLPEAIIRYLLRFGFPIIWWRRIAPLLHPLARRVMAGQCDLWIFPAQDVWSYAFPLPALTAIHDLMHRYECRFPEVSKFGLFARRERHYRRICRHVRGVLVDSVVGKRQVMDSYGLANGRLHVLPFIAPPHLQEGRVPEGFERRYPLPARYLFYPAQFWEHKNHIRLLQALDLIRHQVPDLQLVFVGSKKNAYSRVLAAMMDLDLGDRVHVLGYVPDQDMAGLYRRARGMIMPTFFGPTNIPPLEAMVIGCPMAVSNIYAMPEQVGDAALLFDPRSVEEIADAMLRLATDDALCLRLANAGKARAAAWGQAHFNARFRQILCQVLAT